MRLKHRCTEKGQESPRIKTKDREVKLDWRLNTQTLKQRRMGRPQAAYWSSLVLGGRLLMKLLSSWEMDSVKMGQFQAGGRGQVSFWNLIIVTLWSNVAREIFV